MLTDLDIKVNREKFIDLLWEIDREDCDIEGLINYLDDSDFFTAPASTKYHCSYPGGLCEHSLNVYYALNSLMSKTKDTFNCLEEYDSNSILIVGLLHDLCKINFYEETIKNEKVYSKSGKKYDELGNYDWVSSKIYKVKDAQDRKLLGNKGNVSYIRVSQFLQLTTEEMFALMYQYSAVDREQVSDLSEILAKYNLCVYLHSADIITTFCIEHD